MPWELQITNYELRNTKHGSGEISRAAYIAKSATDAPPVPGEKPAVIDRRYRTNSGGEDAAATEEREMMREYIRQLFSESGEASFGRTGSFLGLVLGSGWISFLVWTTHHLPDLQGLTIFISTLYGLSKTGETVQRVMGKKE